MKRVPELNRVNWGAVLAGPLWALAHGTIGWLAALMAFPIGLGFALRWLYSPAQADFAALRQPLMVGAPILCWAALALFGLRANRALWIAKRGNPDLRVESESPWMAIGLVLGPVYTLIPANVADLPMNGLRAISFGVPFLLVLWLVDRGGPPLGARPTLWERYEHERRVGRLMMPLLAVGDVVGIAIFALPLLMLVVALVVMILGVLGAQVRAGDVIGVSVAASAGVSIVFASLFVLFTLRDAPTKILGAVRAVPIPTGERPRLKACLLGMRVAVGFKEPPELWLIESASVNAMAVGYRADRSYIALTTGTIEKLAMPQIEAVFAHLLTRIASGDAARATARAAIVASIPSLEDPDVSDGLLWPVRWLGVWGNRRRSSVSLERADVSALFLLKDPEVLVATLESIARYDNFVLGGSGAVGTVFISWPGYPSPTDLYADEDVLRIARLEELIHGPNVIQQARA